MLLAASLLHLLSAQAQSMLAPNASPTTQTIADDLKVDMVASDALSGDAKDTCQAKAKHSFGPL